MWSQYGEQVRFLVVYIREAHAVDGGWPVLAPDVPVIEDPLTLTERREVAAACMLKLTLEPMPAVVDDMQDTANLAYQAWPDRLVLVDADGRIAFRTGPGPAGFKPDELEDALRRELELPPIERAAPSPPPGPAAPSPAPSPPRAPSTAPPKR